MLEIFHHGLIHKLIPIPEAMKTPEGKAANDEEWGKLKSLTCWDESTDKPKAAVVQGAKKRKRLTSRTSWIFVI